MHFDAEKPIATLNDTSQLIRFARVFVSQALQNSIHVHG